MSLPWYKTMYNRDLRTPSNEAMMHTSDSEIPHCTELK